MDDWRDPVIEAYKKDVDVTLIDERLKHSVEQRLVDLMNMQEFVEEMRRAGHEALGRAADESASDEGFIHGLSPR